MVTISWYPFLQKQNNQIKTIFWNGIAGSVLSFTVALAIEEINFNISWKDWLYILGHSGSFGLLLPIYLYACSALAGTLITIIGTTSTVYVVIAQYTFLSGIHPGNHNWIEILGIVVVLVSSMVPAYMRAKQQKGNSDKTSDNMEVCATQEDEASDDMCILQEDVTDV